MKYALIQNGTVTNLIESDAAFIDDLIADQPGLIAIATDTAAIGWSWDGSAFVPPPPPADPDPVPEDRRITRLAFINRFTDAEHIARDLASIDSPAAPTEQRQLAAALRLYKEKVDAATHIDLARADTRQGVQALATHGLLAAHRPAEILDGPIQDHERPTR